MKRQPLPLRPLAEPGPHATVDMVTQTGRWAKTWWHSPAGWIDVPPRDWHGDSYEVLAQALSWGQVVGRAIDQRLQLVVLSP